MVLIILVTVGIVLLLPGDTEKNTSGDNPGGDGKADGQFRTEVKTEELTEKSTGKAVTESVSGKETEEKEGSDTSATTEKATKETTEGSETDTSKTETETEQSQMNTYPDGSGLHSGRLGSSFEIPEGFEDRSTNTEEEGYFYIFYHPEYDMKLQVAEYHLNNKKISFEMEYSVLHNMYHSDVGSEVTYDVKEDDHYVISGYTDNRTRVFYVEGFKKPDRNEVQISGDYPWDDNKTVCDGFLEVLQNTLQYNFIANPDQKKEEKTESVFFEGQEL